MKDGDRTYVLDHYEETFVIKTRSLVPISESVLRRLIEEKYEVVELNKTDSSPVGIECYS